MLCHLPRHSPIVLFGAFLATGCGGPTSPSPLGPTLICPVNLTVQSLDGNASPVVYDPPQVVAGEPPLRTRCSPESGANFLLGASTVTCTTTDAAGRTASCAFTVTLVVPHHIEATSFVAFGNSITEGKQASGVLAKSYPENLRELLAARYSSQTFVVVNAGCGGESTMAGAGPPCIGGVVRLPAVLDTIHPEVLLLEEGINDLSGGNPSAIQPLIDAVRSMVREAKTRGIIVFLATFTPVRAGGTPPRGNGPLPVIPEANAQIRLLAQSEHATLVDLYEGFGGSPDPYIDSDGLHPTEPGYQKIAQLFFDAIRTRLELPRSATSLVRNMPAQRPPFTRLR